MSEVKMGRPAIGITRKVSVTLPETEWVQIEKWIDEGQLKSISQYFRIVHEFYNKKK